MMLFTDGTYYVFLIAVFFAYWATVDGARSRVVFIAAVGCLFYLIAGGWALSLLLMISTVDFLTARSLGRESDRKRRKRLLFSSVVLDIGVLCLFKYADFIIESVSPALHLFVADVPRWRPAAPIGISFFIFQSLSCVIDVYRRDTEAPSTFLEYLSFVSFFPTIVAGPILRVRNLVPQLRGRLTLDPAIGGQALFLIAIGLIKKIAIADYLSSNLVDRVFDFPERFSSFEVLVSIYGYALQIYADFSGYTDVAIGSAMLLGLRLPVNFDAPYRASDLPDFWRRWHISLSTWLRDYVFFSIAGRRARNTAFLYAAVIATMLIGGLWHGAAWTFVVWGLLHGCGLAVVRWWSSFRKNLGITQRASAGGRFIAVFVTFHFVCLSWIFFRAESVGRAVEIIKQLCGLTTDVANLGMPVVLIIAIGYATHWMPDRGFEVCRDAFVRLPAPLQAFVLFGMAVGLYFVASTDVVPFIYSRF